MEGAGRQIEQVQLVIIIASLSAWLRSHCHSYMYFHHLFYLVVLTFKGSSFSFDVFEMLHIVLVYIRISLIVPEIEQSID